MDQVRILVPMPTAEETLELEVTWGPDVPPDERADQIRRFLRSYDSEWSLVQIGAPGEGKVPITFR